MDMKLSSVVKALGSLCLLVADGFPVSKDEAPKIIGPHNVKVKVDPGQGLVLQCKAFANCDDDATLIYWLVNGSFPEDASSSGRIVELDESTSAAGAILQRNLQFKNVTSEDFTSTFICVVTNAMGKAQKQITLAAPTRGCSHNKKH